MISAIKRFFLKPIPQLSDPEDILEEYWVEDFSKNDSPRFLPEEGQSYTVHITNKGLTLSLLKKNIYAWTVNQFFRYKNCVIEGTFSFDKQTLPPIINETQAGSKAAGFLFRYINESTFYSLLVSEKGFVRIDAVINGTPMPILGWTETAASSDIAKKNELHPNERHSNEIHIRVIVLETSFTVIINDQWVAECADDTIQAAGKISVAAQNWGICDEARIQLKIISIESRPFEIEAQHSRWNALMPIQAATRLTLARTWYAMGKYIPAILELKKAWKDRDPETEELLLAAQVYVAQQLLPEAETEVRKALALNQNHTAVIAELASILYLQNRFIELEELLTSISDQIFEESALLSTLEGHLYHWKNEYEKSAQAYKRAAEKDETQGIYFHNEALEWMSAGKQEEGIQACFNAGRFYLANGRYSDLEEILQILREKAPDDKRTFSLLGKYFYVREETDKAFEFLEKALSAGSQDSAVYYLYGLMLFEEGDPQKAIPYFTFAAEAEPEYALYQYRLAEVLFHSDSDCTKELEKALACKNADGWVFNLASMKALGENNIDQAEHYIAKARMHLPDELPILINYAEIQRQKGLLEAVLPLFDTGEADFYHAAANLLVADGRNDEAEQWYIKAQKKKPYDPALLADRAANCIEMNLYNEADDLLSKALDAQSSPRVYKLISFLSGRKGEYTRAEVALQQGLLEFPGNTDLLYELSAVYLATKQESKAEKIIESLDKNGDRTRSKALEKEILEIQTIAVICSDCDMIWRVPKNIDPQGSLHLTAEPPDNLPAGTCPECKTSFCIGCAKNTLGDDGRFKCTRCGHNLKLIDNNIIWLLNQWQHNA